MFVATTAQDIASDANTLMLSFDRILGLFIPLAISIFAFSVIAAILGRLLQRPY